MRIKFNEAKATQGAVRLLSLRGGKMSYMKLIKLLYLVDREALRRWGWPVTTDSYVSMDKGPVLSRVLNLINEGNDPGDETGVWSHYISETEGFDIELKANALPSDELSVAEEKLIDEVFEQYGHMNRWALVDLLHKLPEWQDPKGSAIPIQYSDILKAVGKSEIEVAAAVAELESVSASEFLVRSI
jgi:uncharacterized phage-associated protein